MLLKDLEKHYVVYMSKSSHNFTFCVNFPSKSVN